MTKQRQPCQLVKLSAPTTCQLRVCRHVVLPPEIAQMLPKGRLLSEVSDMYLIVGPGEGLLLLGMFSHCLLAFVQNEWRALGVQQSRGWVHYAIHRPEPHILLYRCGEWTCIGMSMVQLRV